MRLTITSDWLREVNARESEGATLWLIKIDPPDGDPIRVTSDGVATTSNGAEYLSFPFVLELPGESDDDIGDGRLTISNVDPTVAQAIDGLEEPAVVSIFMVRAANPDQIESEWPDFELVNTRTTAQSIEGNLALENYAQEPFPADSMDPANTPGLF